MVFECESMNKSSTEAKSRASAGPRQSVRESKTREWELHNNTKDETPTTKIIQHNNNQEIGEFDLGT